MTYGVGAGTTELHVLRARLGVDPRYVAYALRSKHFIEEGVAAFQGVAGLQRVPDLFVRDFEIADLPIREQHRIADFLDAETARIDESLHRLARQLDLVRERRSSRLSEAVAPAALVARPGPIYPWLSEQKYPMAKLAWIATLQTGVTVDGSRDVLGTTRYPYLRVANVQDGWIDLGDVKEISVPADVAAQSKLRAGDVLMTEGGDLDKLGRGMVWAGQVPDCLHQNHVFAVRPNLETLSPDFLALMTRTHHARCYFESTGNRTTNLASTNSSKILAFRFPLPPPAVQAAIVREQAQEDGLYASLVARRERQLALFNERRQALVTAAVTGQLDLTTARGAA
jgi:type I restriction enzyme, S subunit